MWPTEYLCLTPLFYAKSLVCLCLPERYSDCQPLFQCHWRWNLVLHPPVWNQHQNWFSQGRTGFTKSKFHSETAKLSWYGDLLWFKMMFYVLFLAKLCFYECVHLEYSTCTFYLAAHSLCVIPYWLMRIWNMTPKRCIFLQEMLYKDATRAEWLLPLKPAGRLQPRRQTWRSRIQENYLV